MNTGYDADVIVIGGGFYGACVALFMRSIADRVVVLESKETLLSRASYVNQARIHSGFHYPRSFVTARRSLAHYERFMQDFPESVVDNFQMLYAISRFGSRVSAKRFERMFLDLGAPISQASDTERALFSPELIEDVFRCREFAFNAGALRSSLEKKLSDADVKVITGETVVEIDCKASAIKVSAGETMNAPVILDTTYGQLNCTGGLTLRQRLKYELAEVALITPPAVLHGFGVTVMDGPFFSTMPFPSTGDYSLTHVRYTPHKAWLSGQQKWPDVSDTQRSNWLHMARDAARYMPCMADLGWKKSLFEIKSVLLRNEGDDGRPILFERLSQTHRIYSILGGKFDNIYDLFDAMTAEGGIFTDANTGYLRQR